MRHIPLEGASNFRDFGGYEGQGGRRVKQGLLYRSDRLSELTAGDYDTLAPRRIVLVCDLRRDSEAKSAPTNWAGDSAPTILRMPLFNDEAGLNTFQMVLADPEIRTSPARTRQMMVELYQRLVTAPTALAGYRGIFARLAAPRAYPILVHCSGGKDRTGVVCALLQSVLGVSRADILSDFMLTQQYYDGVKNLETRVPQLMPTQDMDDWSLEALSLIFSVEAAYLEAALDLIDREHGSADRFLVDAVSVPAADLDTIRSLLLE
jgi:protein-tyrosine phosphatase